MVFTILDKKDSELMLYALDILKKGKGQTERLVRQHSKSSY
jgi:hypothetical protein